MSIAMPATPPVAPVTSTAPRAGVRPCSSSASTLSAEVNPPVPTTIASRVVSRSGSGTIHDSGTRAYWA